MPQFQVGGCVSVTELLLSKIDVDTPAYLSQFAKDVDKEVKEIVIIPWRNNNVTTTSSACEDGDDVEGLVPSENNSLQNQNGHCNNVHESNNDDKSA